LQLLLCVLLFLVMLLVSRMVSSLAGIKLKRLNHRQRMMDLSKRVGDKCCILGVAFWVLHCSVSGLNHRQRRMDLSKRVGGRCCILGVAFCFWREGCSALEATALVLPARARWAVNGPQSRQATFAKAHLSDT